MPAAAPALTTGEFTTVPLALPPGVFTEIPPDILPGGQRLSYYLTTERSARCDTPTAETAVSRVAIDCQGPGRSALQVEADYLSATPLAMPLGREHRRSYYGIYTAVHARGADGAFSVVSATHGENKNVVRDGLFYQNSVYLGADALVPPAGSCVSGPDPATGVYADCYEAYSGFIGTAVTPVDAESDWGLDAPRDLGPAVWPIGGYTSADRLRRFDHGVRHPSIANGGDGFLYMFYYDDGLLPDRERAGFRVARAPESQLGRGWQTWVQSRGAWVDALPLGPLGPEGSGPALAQPSPAAASEALFPSSASVFAVAKVAGRRGFVGIDQGRDYTRPCVTADGRADWHSATRIRVSADGAQWSAPVELRGPSFDDCDFYPNSRITYPRFLNAAGTSTKEISLDDFSIIGTKYGGTVWRVSVKAPELAQLLPADTNATPVPDRPAVPVPAVPPVVPPLVLGASTGRTQGPAVGPLPKPQASLTARGLRSARAKGPVIRVKVRSCSLFTTAVRVKVAGKLRTLKCGRTRDLLGLRANRVYTVISQPVLVNARGTVIATGRKGRRKVRLPPAPVRPLTRR